VFWILQWLILREAAKSTIENAVTTGRLLFTLKRHCEAQILHSESR